MKKKDLNKIAGIEKAISKKYGKEAIQNPKSNWDEQKEESFLESAKKFYARTLSTLKKKNKFSNKTRSLSCLVCGKDEYFFKSKDEISYSKWQVCYDCFISKIEDREDAWLKKRQKDKESVFEN